MSKDIAVFYFHLLGRDLPVRITDRDGNPWFVASDVCRVLGYVNAPQVVSKLDEDEKMTIRNPDSHSGTRGGAQSITIISESGLYSLIMRSNKPEAKVFRKWVTGTVLPSIRKHGGYVSGQEKVATGEMSREELLAKAVKAADSVLAEMEQRALAAENKVVELEPVAAVAAEHFGMGRHMTVTRFARTLDGVNSMSIKASLKSLGYLYRAPSGGYRVYAKYRDKLFRDIADMAILAPADQMLAF